MTLITRADADALIPVEESRNIIKGIESKSIALSLFTRLPNMSTKQTKMPVLSSLPVAYWQSADNSVKNLSKAIWENKYLVAEEIAVIVPIPENVLNDAEYDIWGEIKPQLIEAFGKKIDDAMLFGVDTPSTWPKAIVPLAIERGYAVIQGVGTGAFLEAGNSAMDKVESAGYEVDGIVGGANINGKFRRLVDSTGQLIVDSDFGKLPRFRATNGAFNTDKYDFIVGNFKQAVYAIRQDMTYKLLDQAIIQDPSDSSILYNLAQQDMVALRAVMRIAYQVPNPVNRLKPTESGRYPFAVCGVATEVKVATPVLVPGTATTFTTSQVVSMSCTTVGAKIYYTNDGTAPDATKTLYTAPITLEATKTIKAIAILSGYTNSDVVTVTYTLNA